jgi:tRNA(fMet)-specific endonuclease VapC
MVILDTDHLSLLQRGSPEGLRIAERLRTLPPDDVATTIISFEEQVRGWLARLAQAKSIEREVSDYAQLRLLLRSYGALPVLEFGPAAAEEFRKLKDARIRIGTMDLKIAAIALAENGRLLTRNTSDFSKVPGLVYEDWSA